MTLIDDDLWAHIEPLLPKRRPRQRQYAGRKPIPDRAVLTGILFVLRSGLPWNMLPKEMGCGSGTTCWRRLLRWQRAGVWKRLHRVLLVELRRRGRIDLARAVVDSASLRALRGGKKLDRTLPIAAKPGRNIMFLPTRTGFRSSRASRRRTGTT
jgi:transposase